MIKFELNDGGKKIKIDLRKLEKIISCEFKKSGTISVAFVGGKKIKEYNRRYRHKDRSTDILTFVLNEKNCLGEIVLSPADAKKRAKISGKSAMETITYLIIHGVCHIFGHTHKKKEDTLRMEKKEKKILEQL